MGSEMKGSVKDKSMSEKLKIYMRLRVVREKTSHLVCEHEQNATPSGGAKIKCVNFECVLVLQSFPTSSESGRD